MKKEGESLKALGFADLKELQSSISKSSSVKSVAFSPDGRRILAGSSDKTVKLWDVASKKLLHTFKGHTGIVYSVAFSADGSSIVSGSNDGRVNLWDVGAKKLLHSFGGHTAKVSSVAFSPDGRRIVSGSWDKTVKLWDVASKKLLHSFEEHSGYVFSVAFSPDGHHIASGSWDKTLKLWDLASLKLLHSFEGHSDFVTSVAFSPDGRHIVSGSWDKTLKLWDLASLKLLYSFEGHSDQVTSVAFSSDGRNLISGSWDNSVKTWDVKKRREVQTLISGQGGNWAIIENQQRIFRGDDGTFINQAVPLNKNSEKDELSLQIAPITESLKPGESWEVEVQVINNGAQAAYWLSLLPAYGEDRSIRLEPPNRAFKGRGRQEWKATHIAKLEAGETASLSARIFPNLTLPGNFVASGIKKLSLTVKSANGTEVSQTIEVDLQSPFLEWGKAAFDRKTEILKIELTNSGTSPFKDIHFSLREEGSNTLLGEPTHSELKPGEKLELAFPIPREIDLEKIPLTLSGRTADLPIYAWDLPSPKIEFVGQFSRFSMWLLTPILLVTIISIAYLRRYRHPLVLQLSNDPAALLQLQPEQLAEAQTRLQQTRRLQNILSLLELSPKRLKESIAFFDNLKPDEKAKVLAKRLGGKLKFLEADMLIWELRCQMIFRSTSSVSCSIFHRMRSKSVTY